MIYFLFVWLIFQKVSEETASGTLFASLHYFHTVNNLARNLVSSLTQLEKYFETSTLFHQLVKLALM